MKINTILQGLCPELHTGVGKVRSLYDPDFYANWWSNDGTLKYSKGYKDSNGDFVKWTPEKLDEYVKKCEVEKLGFVFASGPCPAYENQHCVFNYSAVGVGEKIFRYKPKMHEKVRIAHDSIFSNIQKIRCPEEPQVIEKKHLKKADVPMESAKLVVKVRYSKNGDLYSFYAKQVHFTGDFACVKSKDGYVNVEIVECSVMTTSQILKLISEINAKNYMFGRRQIADLSWLYTEIPLAEPYAWTQWTKADIPEKYHKYMPDEPEFGDTDGDAVFEEDIDELEAMREAFMPAADITYTTVPEYSEMYSGEYDDMPE